MSDRRNIEIVGGGLAGLSLGTALLREGIPTTVLEAGDYPRHRVCGEFIAGLEASVIAALGLDSVLEGSIRHSTVSWHWQGRKIGIQRLPVPAWGICRRTLDARLAAGFVAAGGDLRCNTRAVQRGCAPGRVLATGRSPRAEGWIGLKVHARGMALADDLEVHLGRGCYVGLCRVDEGWINICGMFPRAELRGNRGVHALNCALERGGLAVLAGRLRDAEVRPGSEAAIAGLAFAETDRDESRLHIGDACGAVPPFTGHGMALAFQSAACALPPLRAWARKDCSWAVAVVEARAAIRRCTAHRLRLARVFHPWLLCPRRQRLLSAMLRLRLLPMTLLTRVLHG